MAYIKVGTFKDDSGKVDFRWNLKYEDVFIVPQYSEITSRKQVDTSVKIGNLTLDVPVISSNMDTVTDSNMAIAMYKAGAIGALHRFLPIKENIDEYKKVVESGSECFVSVGTSIDGMSRSMMLLDSGARYFIIDIAHGHSIMMRDMIRFLRDQAGSAITIIAGNVATAEATYDLKKWGADIVKVGIGPGAVCLTKNVTGVTRPQFSAVWGCSQCDIPIVADGGMREIGDICKAIGIGATYVMSGKMFASCVEAPGARVNGRKVYRGMASKDAMLTIRDEEGLPIPEGMSTMIDENGTAEEVINNIKGGLQSAMSYSNSKDINEFHELARFSVCYP